MRRSVLVDSGRPSSWSRITAAVEGLGRRPGDLRAVLLTHGHADPSLSRDRGPRLLPDALQADPAVARTSLDVLEPLEAELLLPGRGTPWRGSPADAVRRARAADGRR